MKFSELFSGQRIIEAFLSFLQTSKNEAIKERLTDIFEDGVVENELNNLSIIGKDVDALLQVDRVKVDIGVAYKDGERIFVDDATIPYDVNNTILTTDDGKGNPILTPHSTGSFDIDLAPFFGSVVSIFVKYLLTTDELEFTLHKITNVKQFFKRTDGYDIRVNTTGTPPSADFILLGTVDMTTGTGAAIASNISIVNRPLARTKVRRIGIETGNLAKTDRPVSYSLGNNKISLDDHIKSVGDGTVDEKNPHGTALKNLGVQPNQTVEVHRQLEHSNAIIAGITGDPFPTGSAMFVLAVAVGGGLQDFVTVKALGVLEVATVNGTGFGSSAFNSDVNLFFTDDNTGTGTPLAADTYQIIFDSVTETVDKIQGGTPITDPTKLWLATVVYDGIDALVGSTLDRRPIGGTVNKLQRWTSAGRPDASIVVTGQFGYNVDLNQPEYFNGSSWVQI